MEPAPLLETWPQLMQVLPAFLVRSGVAVICGAIIGIERELKQKPAGFRTNILICLGAAIYTTVGLLLQEREGVDVSRVAAQVVTGIGFLGAGSIIQAGGSVKGLTTAATIWVVASIGILSGAGFPLLALLSAVLVLITLAVLGSVEDRLFSMSHSPDE